MTNQELRDLVAATVSDLTKGMSEKMAIYTHQMAECILDSDDIQCELDDISMHGISGGIAGHIYTQEIYERLKPVYLDVIRWYYRIVYDLSGCHISDYFPRPISDRKTYTDVQCLLAYMLQDAARDDDTLPSWDMVIYWLDSAILEYIVSLIIDKMEGAE